MPQCKLHASPAARQAAYRSRGEQARRLALDTKGLPALPVIATLPGWARWNASFTAAQELTYKTAMRVMAPQLVANPDPKDPTIIPGIRDQRDTPSEVVGRNFSDRLRDGTSLYRKMLMESPISSLILGGTCFFIVVVAGTLIILTFQIQRRRYATHRALSSTSIVKEASDKKIEQAGFEEALGDPVLIVRALSLFISIIVLTGWLVFGLLIYQLVECLHAERSWTIKCCLGYIAVIVILKLTHTTYMLRNFIEFEKREGNDYLLVEGTDRLERIRRRIERPELDADFNDLLSLLSNPQFTKRGRLWGKLDLLKKRILSVPAKDQRALTREQAS